MAKQRVWRHPPDVLRSANSARRIRHGPPSSDGEVQELVQETVVAVAKQMRAGGYDRTKSSFKNWLTA